MDILDSITQRTHLIITLCAMAGISFLVILFVSLNRPNHISGGPYEVQTIKVECPGDLKRSCLIFGKNITLGSQTRIWYPSDPSLENLIPVIMFPKSRVQYRGFCWMANQLASRGYVVTICKHKMHTDWLNMIPGIRQKDDLNSNVQERDLCAMSGFIAELTRRNSQLAGRLSLQQTGIVSRLGFYDIVNDSGTRDTIKEMNEGVLLAIVREDETGMIVISQEEFLPFNGRYLKEKQVMGLRAYWAKWIDLAKNHLGMKGFFPVRMVFNLLRTFKEMNMRNYVNIQEEMVYYFSTKIEFS